MKKSICLTGLAVVSVLFLSLVACTRVSGAEPGGPKSGPSEWAYVGEESSFSLWAIGDVTRIVADQTAANGQCAWEANDKKSTWGIQWAWDAKKTVKNTVYTLFAVIKVRKTGNIGDAFGFGVYDVKNSKALLQTKGIRARQMEDNTWQTVEVLRFCPEADQYVYVKGVDNFDNVPDIFVDCFYLEPEINAENRAKFVQLNAEARDFAVRTQEFLRNYKPISCPQVADRFVYGFYNEMEEGLRENAKLFGETWQERLTRQLYDYRKHYVDTVAMCNSPANDFLEEVLTIADGQGVMVWPGAYLAMKKGADPKTFSEKEFARNIKEVIPRFQRHPSLLSWYFFDEPRPDEMYPLIYAKQIIDSLDPQHPALVTLASQEAIRTYAPYMQVVITDFYPIKDGYRNPWSVGDWLEYCRKITDKPVWFVTQACDAGNIGRRPTVEEFRLMSYLAVAYGATGLIPYHSGYIPIWKRGVERQFPVDEFDYPSPLWDEVGRIGRALTAVGPLLAGCRLVEKSLVQVTGENIVAGGKKRDAILVKNLAAGPPDRNYLVAVNNDIKREQKGTLTLNGASAKDKSVFDLYDLKEIRGGQADELKFDVQLLPGDGRIYLVGTKGEFESVKRDILKNRFRKEFDTFKVDYDWAVRCNLNVKQTSKVLEAAQTVFSSGEEAKALLLLDQAEICLRQAMDSDASFSRINQSLNTVQRLLHETNEILEYDVLTALKPAWSNRVNKDDQHWKFAEQTLLPVATRYFCGRNQLLRGELANADKTTAGLVELAREMKRSVDVSFPITK